MAQQLPQLLLNRPCVPDPSPALLFSMDILQYLIIFLAVKDPKVNTGFKEKPPLLVGVRIVQIGHPVSDTALDGQAQVQVRTSSAEVQTQAQLQCRWS